jgi:hypothetical protein
MTAKGTFAACDPREMGVNEFQLLVFSQEQDVLSILLWDGSKICQNVAHQASAATKNQAMFSVCGHPSPCAKETVSAGRSN